MCIITYLGEIVYTIKQEKDVDNFLKQIDNELLEKKPIYALEKSNCGILTFGIGKNIGFLNYTDETRDPPYLSSFDISNVDLNIENFYCGELTEIPTRNCIPVTEVIDALKYFISTGKPSSQIKWEED